MQHSSGISLIELLISVLLMTILLVGIDAVQLAALKQAQANYYFSAAEQQVRNAAEHLALFKICDDAKLNNWHEQNTKLLPQGTGRVEGIYPNCKIIIYWGNISERECTTTKMGQDGCLYLGHDAG